MLAAESDHDRTCQSFFSLSGQSINYRVALWDTYPAGSCHFVVNVNTSDKIDDILKGKSSVKRQLFSCMLTCSVAV